MMILFPRRKGVKIATTIILEEIQAGASASFLMGMLHFARRFGAITQEEQSALIQYIEERG